MDQRRHFCPGTGTCLIFIDEFIAKYPSFLPERCDLVRRIYASASSRKIDQAVCFFAQKGRSEVKNLYLHIEQEIRSPQEISTARKRRGKVFIRALRQGINAKI